MEAHLLDLHRTLGRGVAKAREMLRKLISEVRLIPVGLERPDAYLEAEVIGNVNGLLSLQPALADTIGGGGEDLHLRPSGYVARKRRRRMPGA